MTTSKKRSAWSPGSTNRSRATSSTSSSTGASMSRTGPARTSNWSGRPPHSTCRRSRGGRAAFRNSSGGLRRSASLCPWRPRPLRPPLPPPSLVAAAPSAAERRLPGRPPRLGHPPQAVWAGPSRPSWTCARGPSGCRRTWPGSWALKPSNAPSVACTGPASAAKTNESCGGSSRPSSAAKRTRIVVGSLTRSFFSACCTHEHP
mmetsp:Transcript_128137/g.369083  ORF Transcript_128137/g.369083 Transcript_128137/m.369083 type:complete len:204 (+) Transcript_128137:712-1323(+)